MIAIMADLTISASAVVRSTSALTINGNAGETIAAGETVYLNETDGKYYLADGNDTDKMPVAGIANNSASNNQPIVIIQQDPDLTIGAHGATVGDAFFQSANAGKVCPLADLAAGNQATSLMVVKTSTAVSFGIITGGVIPA